MTKHSISHRLSDQALVLDTTGEVVAHIDYRRGHFATMPTGPLSDFNEMAWTKIEAAQYWALAMCIERVPEPEDEKPAADEKAAAPVLVREASRSGPCIVLGELVSQTRTTITYREKDTGKIKRRGGWKVAENFIHTEPCRSCRDHEKTFYPNGYQD